MDNNGAIYIDDIDMRQFGFKPTYNHSNPAIAPTKDITMAIAGKNGAYHYGSYLEAIPFNFECKVPSANLMDQQNKIRKLKGILLDGEGKPKQVRLRFGYEPDKYYNVVYSGTLDIDRNNPYLAAFTVPMVAYDTNAYSVSSNKDVKWGSEDVFFSNSTYVFGHSGDGEMVFTSPGSTTIFVAGDTVKPIIKVRGTANNFSINFNGYVIGIKNFINSTIVIDLQEFVVLKNNVLALDQIIGNDWLSAKLDSGVNTISISGTNMNIELNVEFNDRFN